MAEAAYLRYNHLIQAARSSVLKQYRGFLFDADNTLFDFDRCEAEALSETIGSHISSGSELLAEYRRINALLWERFARNDIDPESLKVERFRLLLRRIRSKEDPEKTADRFLRRLARKHYLMPHAAAVLGHLSGRALTGLVTNGFEFVQKSRIARAELEVFFDHILISEEIGVAKPDPAIFLLASTLLNLPPHDILCVGDDPVTDIQGAHAAGMATCWYSPSPRGYPRSCAPPDITITDLQELKGFAGLLS